jgi:hypothetical protein
MEARRLKIDIGIQLVLRISLQTASLVENAKRIVPKSYLYVS